MSQLTSEQEEILQKWKDVARRYEKSIHFDFSEEHYNESIVELKKGVERFLDDPKEETFNDFWDRLWAAWRGASATSLLKRWNQEDKTIQELKKLIKEIYKSSEYDKDWEQMLGAKNSLRELYGKLKLEEYPIQNSCASNSLKWFEYKPKQSYADFQKEFKEFKNEYLSTIGHVTKDTDHEVPINLEIDQLFNVIDKVTWTDLEKEGNREIRDFYEMILVQKNDDLTRVNDLIIYYLKNEKENHIAHKDEIIKYVQDTQSELVKKGLRTTKGLTTYLTQLKNDGILSIEGLENGYYTLPYQRNYWKISPGPSAKYWNIWRDGEFVAIGWDEIDVSNTDIQKQAEQIYPDENAGYTAKQFNYFVHEMKKGDMVLSYGNNQILGIGEVKSDYYFDESAEEYKHRRGVKWIDLDPKDARHWKTNLYNKLKTNATIVKLTEGDYSSIVNVKCKYYWVNQTRADEINNKYLQAPVDGIWHHKLMDDLMEGDFIFHYYDKRLIGYSNVVEPAYKTEIAGKVKYVSNLSELNRFKHAISLTDIKNYLTKENVRLSKYYPLNPDGEVNQIYLGKLSPKAGEFLLKSHVSVYSDPDLKIENLGCEFDLTNLHFEQKTKDAMVRQITAALKNRKHIILIGPPGTGKSKLAKEICDFYCDRAEYTMTTATSDWSTFDTIGGYVQDENGKLKFSPGVFLKCFHDENDDQINKWLIIDEINRADIDKAFGEMFSALTGDDISLSLTRNDKAIEIIGSPDSNGAVESHRYFIPEDWRIIATMNTFDKTSLYEMSYAFMRRFAFISVDIPKEINVDLINNYLEKWDMKGNEKITDRISEIWAIINKYRKIGPAIIEDVYKYVEATENDFTSALIMYVLPQFEGLDEDKLVEFIKEILKEINDEDDRLISFVSDYFEIHEDKLIE